MRAVPQEALDQLAEVGLTEDKIPLLHVCVKTVAHMIRPVFPHESAHDRTLAAISLLTNQPTEDLFFLSVKARVRQAAMTKHVRGSRNIYTLHMTLNGVPPGLEDLRAEIEMPDSIWPSDHKNVYKDPAGEVIYLYPANIECGCKKAGFTGDVCPLCNGTNVAKTFFDFPPDMKAKTLAMADKLMREGKYDPEAPDGEKFDPRLSESEFKRVSQEIQDALGFDESMVGLLAFMITDLSRVFKQIMPFWGPDEMLDAVTAFLIGVPKGKLASLDVIRMMVKRVLLVRATKNGGKPRYGLRIVFNGPLPMATVRIGLPDDVWPNKPGMARLQEEGEIIGSAYSLYPYEEDCECPEEQKQDGACLLCGGTKKIRSVFFLEDADERVKRLNTMT